MLLAWCIWTPATDQQAVEGGSGGPPAAHLSVCLVVEFSLCLCCRVHGGQGPALLGPPRTGWEAVSWVNKKNPPSQADGDSASG